MTASGTDTGSEQEGVVPAAADEKPVGAVSVTVTLELQKRAMTTYLLHRLVTRSGPVCLIGIALMLFGQWTLPGGDPWLSGFCTCFIVIVVSLWATLLVKARLDRTHRPPLETTYGFCPSSVKVITSQLKGSMPWDEFAYLLKSRRLWLLVLKHRRYLVIPTDLLSAELGEFIVQRMRSNGKPVKRFFCCSK